MMKKLSFGLGLLVLVVVVIGGYIWSNLDSLIKTAVETYGSEAAQTTVELSSVNVSLKSGAGKLSGLRIANPEGFSKDDAFYLGSIEVEIDTDSLPKDGPVVINKIIVDGPKVAYEVNDQNKANLQVLSENFKRAMHTAPAQTEAKPQEADGKAGRKIVIRELAMRGGAVTVAHKMLTKKVEAKIPDFTLKNVGANRDGYTGEQLAGHIMAVLSQNATMAATKSLVDSLVPSQGAIEKSVPPELKETQEMLKGFFSQ